MLRSAFYKAIADSFAVVNYHGLHISLFFSDWLSMYINGRLRYIGYSYADIVKTIDLELNV